MMNTKIWHEHPLQDTGYCDFGYRFNFIRQNSLLLHMLHREDVALELLNKGWLILIEYTFWSKEVLK